MNSSLLVGLIELELRHTRMVIEISLWVTEQLCFVLKMQINYSIVYVVLKLS